MLLQSKSVNNEMNAVKEWESGRQEYFRVNINSKGKPIAHEKEVNVGDKKPLIRPLLQLSEREQAQVAVLRMSKDDFDEAGDRDFSFDR